MTRQNQIPTEDGSRVTLALIPLWDMCNHTNGLVTTFPACLESGKLWWSGLKGGVPLTSHSPLAASLPRERTRQMGPPLPASHKWKLVFFSHCVYLILQMGNLNLILLSKITVNCIYLLSHNSSLDIHFLILLNHRLNQSFFLKIPFYWKTLSFLFLLLCSLFSFFAGCISSYARFCHSFPCPLPPPDTLTQPWPVY